MNYDERFQRYHAGLVPAYVRICRENGIGEPPSVVWMSMVTGEGWMRMVARVLWTGGSPPQHLSPRDIYLRPTPDDVVAHPSKIAEEVAQLVIRRWKSGGWSDDAN